MKGVKVSGIEYHLGTLRESNRDMLVDNPSWDLTAIERATGIISRRLAREGEHASDLGVIATEKLFDRGIVRKDEIDALIVCTQSPDYLLPTTACTLQERLKLSTGTIAFDVNLGCSGYVYSLAIANSLLNSGMANKLLLLNTDTYSKFVSKTDRTCRPIFGDGAAVTLIESADSNDVMGLFDLGTDGRGTDKLIHSGSGVRGLSSASSSQEDLVTNSMKSYLKMDGAGVMMFTMQAVPKTVTALLEKSRLTLEQVDLYFFHQASRTVLDNIMRHLNLPSEKVFEGFSEIGNMVSASIPIALKQAADQGRLKAGQTIMLVGFGVGYSWGSCILKWTGEGILRTE